MKKFLVISRKKAFLIFWETKTQKKVLIFQEAKLFYVSVSNFTSSKNKKLLIFWKTELHSPKRLNKTPLSNHQTFTGCSSIQFYNSPLSPNTVSEAGHGYQPLTLQRLCDLQDITPRHQSPSASHPTLSQAIRGFPQG